MKTKLSILFLPIVLASLALCPGCTTGTASVIKALGSDTSSVTVDVNGWGTTIHITRNTPAK